MVTWSTLRLILFILNIVIAVAEFDVKQPGPKTSITLRTGESYTLPLPYNFQFIKEINAQQTKDSKEQSVKDSPVCKGSKVQVAINTSYAYTFKEFRPNRDVIVDYEDLLNAQFVLDLFADQNTLFLILQDGQVRIFDISDNSVSLQKTLSHQNISNLSQGYFVQGPKDSVLFFNSQHALLVTKDQITPLEGYHAPCFESVAFMSLHQAFAVACGTKGVSVYTLDNYTLTRAFTLDSQILSTPLDISDLAYLGGSLYLLNRYSTVIQYSPRIDDLSKYSWKLTSMGRSKCESLEIINNRLYIACPELWIYDVTNFSMPQVLYKYQHPRFSVKNLVPAGDLTILTGQNIVKVYFRDLDISVFQDFMLDRLIYLNNETLLLASEFGIILSRWILAPPAVVCGVASDSGIEGPTNTVLDVYAECSSNYFRSMNIQVPKDETCVYHFPVEIDFWIGKQINFIPFYGIMLIVLGTAIGLAGVCMIVRNQYKQIKQALADVSKKSAGKGYSEMIEEFEPQTIHHSGNPAEVQSFNNSQSNTEPQLVSQQLHQIGE